MIRKKKGNIEWLEFELLAECPRLTHAVFLRKGGISHEVQYSSLNALSYGDDPKYVSENRKRMCAILNINHLVFSKHAHDKHVVNVKIAKNKKYSGYDALMTQCHNVGLMITHADCQAAIFYDPLHNVCANVHAGWRGQVKNIYQNTVLKMKEEFSTNPKDLLVCISPSLGPENAEFINYRTEFPKEFWDFETKANHFNLWAIARYQLENEGILSHHIQIAELDTFAHPEDFFSYRREKKQGRSEKITGAHGTIVVLN